MSLFLPTVVTNIRIMIYDNVQSIKHCLLIEAIYNVWLHFTLA